MSFILDAIAKSEQERRQLEMPGAESLSIPTERTPQKKSRLMLLVVAALLLNAGLITLWIQSDQSDYSPVEMITESMPQKSQVSSEAVDNTPVPDRAAAGELNSEQEPEFLIATENISESPMLDLPEKPAREIEQEETDDWIRVEPNTLLKTVKETESNRTTETLESGQLTVSQLYDLPEIVRKDLPTVKFTGHLYSSNPANSVVFLENQRPVMQGQQIVDKVYLHEITPDGVIVSFKGYLIGVGVLQNWTLN